jgi:hypothetical protein
MSNFKPKRIQNSSGWMLLLKVSRQFGLLSLMGGLGCVIGCGKPTTAPAPGPGLATQADSAAAASTYADARLAELTRELRRWIVRTKERPSSFEDFVAKAGIKPPAPPAGKKYALSKEMRVMLVDR